MCTVEKLFEAKVHLRRPGGEGQGGEKKQHQRRAVGEGQGRRLECPRAGGGAGRGTGATPLVRAPGSRPCVPAHRPQGGACTRSPALTAAGQHLDRCGAEPGRAFSGREGSPSRVRRKVTRRAEGFGVCITLLGLRTRGRGRRRDALPAPLRLTAAGF